MNQKKIKKHSSITVNEMKDAIVSSGYLLEQRVYPIFQEFGYHVTANAAYPDLLTGKSREIDIKAIHAFQIGEDADFIFANVLCECENNKQPVVFFLQKDPPIPDLQHENIKSAGIPVKFLENVTGREFVNLPDFLNFHKYHHISKGPTSTQYCNFHRKDSNKPWLASHEHEQHNTLLDLACSVEAEIDDYYDNLILPSSEEDVSINVEIYYPLLILQGPLYSAISDINKKIKLREVEYAKYRKEVFLKGRKNTYNIDVIIESFLPKYLAMIEKELDRASNILQQNKQIVQASMDRLINLVHVTRRKDKKKSFREILGYESER